MKINVIRTGSRRTVSIEIRGPEEVTVRAPKRVSAAELERILKKRENWIEEHLEKKRQQQEAAREAGLLSAEMLTELKAQAQKILSRRAEYFAARAGVDYGRITVRAQRTRWGSCSRQGNLSFNCLLMLAPPEILDYVVVHELCHRRQMNHSRSFWMEVEKILPDYREREAWIRRNGGSLMARLPEKA